tara:strand:- start:81 stop:323 length:243 start_codon:yes stop_codon:yes gene_type:complete
MTENITIALISSLATLFAIYLKSIFDKKKDRKMSKETRLLLENLSAKKATIILREDGLEFDFESEASVREFLDFLSEKDK